ncbi:MAG: hypothetical protein QNJ94_14960 [Alphaproteobacteria bacterium]|nr:hypothetical protein [Alphaproteobacteria bacterium]
MAETQEPVRVNLNVMRARLTILGFNLAIITFQIKELQTLGGGIALPGIEQSLHVSAATALFMSLALSIVSMISLIASCATDQDGFCSHWSLPAGDLLMYLALAQTVAGFFGAFHAEFELVALPDRQQAEMLALINAAMDTCGGIAWGVAVYLGPAVSLLRSPFPRRTNVTLGLAYLGLLLLVGRIWTTALHLEAQDPTPASLLESWLGGLVAPLIW